MVIGVVGPFNPASVREYFDKDACLPEINITASSVNTYIQGLLSSGEEVIIFTLSTVSVDTKIFIGKQIKIYCISSLFRIKGFGRYRVHKRIRKYIKYECNNLDILHAEWTYEYAYATLTFVDRLPVFCSVRDWCPYLLSLANGMKEKYFWYMSYYMFNKVMSEKEITFIANSQYTYNCIVSEYPDDSIITIPNPIKSTYILDSREYYPTNSVFVSVCNSLEERRKNILILLEAFQKYIKKNPTSKLIIVGKYSDVWKENMINKGLLHSVELTGKLDHDSVISVMDKATCLIHPALEETFGNILLEGMCRRIPCIGGKESGAVPQVLENGKYGILCDISSIDDLSRAMEETDDLRKMQVIVNRCTDYLKSTYADSVVIKSHLNYFKKAINSNGAAK